MKRTNGKHRYKGPLSNHRSSQRRRIRNNIYIRDKYTCWLCFELVDISLKDGNPMAPTLDHVVAKKDGGIDRPSNLKLAHAICNNNRHNSPSKEIASSGW